MKTIIAFFLSVFAAIGIMTFGGYLLGWGSYKDQPPVAVAYPSVSAPTEFVFQTAKEKQLIASAAIPVVPPIDSIVENLKAQLAALQEENQDFRAQVEELSRELESYRLEHFKTLVQRFRENPVTQELTEAQKEYFTGFVISMLGEIPSDAEILLLAETAHFSEELNDWNRRWAEKPRSFESEEAEILLDEKGSILQDWRQAVDGVLGPDRAAKLFPE